MSDLPLVSVMIPTYRQVDFLAEAVRSVLAQSYRRMEVVVADDDPDSSAAGALTPFASDTRFRYLNTDKNRGRVRNYHWLLHDLARGEYALNLDGDDLFADAGYIARAVSVLETEPDVALVFARRLSFSGDPPALSFESNPAVTNLDGTTVLLIFHKVMDT